MDEKNAKSNIATKEDAKNCPSKKPGTSKDASQESRKNIKPDPDEDFKRRGKRNRNHRKDDQKRPRFDKPKDTQVIKNLQTLKEALNIINQVAPQSLLDWKPDTNFDGASKNYNKPLATTKIPLDDPYWLPCYENIPLPSAFGPGVFFIDQFVILSDNVRANLRFFEDGTIIVERRGETICLAKPESAFIAWRRCEQCTKNDHTIQSCPNVSCFLCGQKGHVGTSCKDPILGPFCLACRQKDHTHNQRAKCARLVYGPKMGRVCCLCGGRNHSVDNCRQSKCGLCGDSGHIGNACTKVLPPVLANAQYLPDQDLDSDEAVLQCMLQVKIGQYTYAAVCNDQDRFSEINPVHVRIKGFDGRNPAVRIPVRIGNIIHEVTFFVNGELPTPVSLGLDALHQFEIRIFIGEVQILDQ